MFSIKSSSLGSRKSASIHPGIPLATISKGGGGIPLAKIDLGASTFSPAAVKTRVPVVETAVIPATPAPAPGSTQPVTVVVPATTPYTQVAAIRIGQTTYQPAANPNSPQPGEFSHNPYTGAIILAPKPGEVTRGVTVQVMGVRSQVMPPISIPLGNINLPGEIKTNRIFEVPSIFRLVPMQGGISISMNFEQHPSGQFRFDFPAEYRAKVTCALRPGTIFSCWGIGLRVNQLQIEELPYRISPRRWCSAQVSLGGAWEKAVEKHIKIKKKSSSSKKSATIGPSGGFVEGIGSTVWVPGGSSGSGGGGGTTIRPSGGSGGGGGTTISPLGGSGTISLSQLGESAGVQYIGASTAIKNSKNATEEECTTFDEHFKSRLRQRGEFACYNENHAVISRNFSSTPVVNYVDEDILEPISTTVQASDSRYERVSLTSQVYQTPAPDLGAFPIEFQKSSLGSRQNSIRWEDQNCYPYGAELNKVTLTGDFDDKDEDEDNREPTRKRPRFKQKPPVIVELWEGDISAASSPGFPHYPKNSRKQQTIITSLCYDASGPTKQLTRTIQEDGFTLLTETWTYGFTGLLSHRNLLWGVVQYQKVVYLYDPETGYMMGNDTSGFKMIRLRQEQPGSRDGSDSSMLAPGNKKDGEFLQLLIWRKVPIVGKHRFLIRTYSSDYRVDRPPLIEYDQEIYPGTTITKHMVDPNYAEPAYVLTESSIFQCYTERRNPDPRTELSQPMYQSGEERYSRSSVTISPAIYEWYGNDTVRYRGSLNFKSFRDYRDAEQVGEEIKPDTFRKWEAQENSLDPGFSSAAAYKRFSDNVGRPSAASRKPKSYIRDDQEEDKAEEAHKDPKKHTISSPGASGACGEQTLNFPHAKTYEEARRAAFTDWLIQDFLNAMSEQFVTFFDARRRPGDRVVYLYNGERRRRRIKGIQLSTYVIYQDGEPLLFAEPMRLDLGIDRYGAGGPSYAKPKPDDLEEEEELDDENLPPDEAPKKANERWTKGEVVQNTLRSRYKPSQDPRDRL